MPNYPNMNLTGKTQASTFYELTQVSASQLFDGIGNSIDFISASLFGTSSWSVSASWAPNSGTSSFVTQSNYMVSSSFASSSISASYALTASYAANAGTTLFTASTYQITSSWTNNSLTSNVAISASWSSASLSSSYLNGIATASLFGTSSWSNNSLISNVSVSSSFASKSFFSVSASWASQSIWTVSSSFASSSNYSISASWASSSLSSSYLNGVATASVFGTASWANNVVNASGLLTVSQSSYDINIRDMVSAGSGALYTNGINLAPLQSSFGDGNPSSLGLQYWYIFFPNQNITGGNQASLGITASIASYQGRLPSTFNNGLTHSFQYYALNSSAGNIAGSNNNIYWKVDLYVVTSSISSNANFFIASKLVNTFITTQSFSGNIYQSGSIQTITSMFTDNSGNLTKNTLIFLNITRMDLDSEQILTGSPPGNGRDYTGSVALISSRYNWNLV